MVLSHESSDAPAADAGAGCSKLSVKARTPVLAATTLVGRTNLDDQLAVCLRTPRLHTLAPHVVAAASDFELLAHKCDGEVGPLREHERELHPVAWRHGGATTD